MSFIVGEMVGPYQVVALLGQGGMATVYKGYHPALDRFVAIKALHPAFLEDETFLARFQREARVVASLDHPNIVPIYDFSELAGRPYLVMKFIEGVTLREALAEHPLPMADILRLMDSVGQALAFAHRQGVLHRDIKPSNILLARDGQIYLTDFGLARLVRSGQSTLTAETLVGTPQYMSPEQAQSLADLDARTDIYSLGVVLYELVVGQAPFAGDTPFSIIHDHIYTPLPLPQKINPNVSSEMQSVLLRALAKKREERYADIASFLDDFHAAVQAEHIGIPGMVGDRNSEPAAFGPYPGVEKTTQVNSQAREKKERGKKPWLLPLGIAAGVVLLCLLGLFVIRGAILNKAAANSPSATPGLSQTAAGTPLPVAASTISAPTLKQTPVGTTVSAQPSPLAAAVPAPPAAYQALQRAIGNWKSGILLLADRNIAQAQQLAGNDASFFMQAGDQFAGLNAWPYAAQMYYDMVRFTPKPVPVEQEQKFRQAVYMAAKNAHAGAFINRAQDQPLFQIAQTRFVLYNGALKDAQDRLTKLLGNPVLVQDYPEVRLLQAEVERKENDQVLAETHFKALQADSNLPEWIRDLAGQLVTQSTP